MAAIREKVLKSRLYRVFLLIILVSMSGGTILFSPLFRGAKPNPSVIMSINDVDISHKEYEQRLAQEYEYIAMLKQRYGQFADNLLKMMGLDNPQQIALKTLINQELLNQVARAMNLDLSSEFVMQKLNDPSFVVNELRDVIPLQALTQQGTINATVLHSWLTAHGQTMADFEKNLEQALCRKIVADLVATSVYISPKEAENYFVSNFLKRKYSILVVPFDKYLKEVRTTTLTDEELTTFFNHENKTAKRYWIPEQRSVTYWSFAPKDFGITIGEKAIQQYYEKHKKEQFVETPVQIKLRRILFKIEEGSAAPMIEKKAREIKQQLDKDPTLFEKLAQEHSDDKETATHGGMLGFVKRGDKDAMFWRAALKLQKDNEVSDLVATNEGIELLQRVERKAPTFKPLAGLKKDIEQTLLRQKFKQQFTKEADRALAAMKSEQKAIDSFVAAKKGTKIDVVNINLTESALSKKSFKLKKGAWASSFDEGGNGLLITVNAIEKAREPQLEEIKNSVKEDLYIKKAQEALDKAVKNFECALKTVSMNDIAQRDSLQIIATDWLKKESAEEMEKLEKQGIPVRGLFFVSDVVGATSKATTAKGGYIAQLDAVEPFDWVLFKDKKQEVLKQLYKEKKDLHIRGFIASLYKNATIKHIQDPRAPQRELPMDDIF
jgi:parvulin-like peptidyl-prolyl isomerase